MIHIFFLRAELAQKRWVFSFLILCIACPYGAYASFVSVSKQELQKYSIRMDSVVNDYYSSGLIGNGLLGASVYKQKGDTLCWELGRADVCDHRSGKYTELYKDCRLPIGKFLIAMNGGSSSMVTDLYKCEVSGKVKNTAIPFSWKTWAPAQHNVLVIEQTGKQLPQILFRPDVSVSPRYSYRDQSYRQKDFLEGYGPNPAPRLYKEKEYTVCKQPLLAGGEYTTVWTVRNLKGRTLLFASIGYSQHRTDTELDAIREIKKVCTLSLRQVEKMHSAWWHAFYAKSYVSVSEDRYDAFFWRQLYKLGSATRSDRCPIDLMGPWFHNDTPWPAIWWNLNIQLTYSPLFLINHSELALPLCTMLDNNVGNLRKNVPASSPYPSAAIGRASTYTCDRLVGKEHGLLTWTLFYYWKYCRYTGEDVRLREKFFPLLKLAVNYYRGLLYKEEDGYLHLPKSHSPEYADAVDCNFELSLLRWGCQTLVRIDEMFAIGDQLLPVWRQILDQLVPYPVDKDGFLIGKNVKLKSGHRHYSHLLMLYPLQNFPLDTPENRELANRSMDFWLGFKKGYYTGYTYTGSSSMSSLQGDGERAYNYLNLFFDKYITPNTLYREAGPCFETPMAALASFVEMLLHTNGNEIKVLPAVPACWKDIFFDRLLAENGFEVSARRIGGKTKEVRIKSLYGGTCTLYCGIPQSERHIKATSAVQLKPAADESLLLDMPAGEEITIQKK